MRKIAPEQAERAYNILVEHAGARDDADERFSFVYHTSVSDHPTTEYRFCGSLGWGGKFRNNGNHGGVPHVDCYREHESPERLAIITRTNEALASLFGKSAA